MSCNHLAAVGRITNRAVQSSVKKEAWLILEFKLNAAMSKKSADPHRINLNLRVTSETKRNLERMSLEDYRSMTNTIEMLIDREVARRAAEKKSKP